MEEPQYRIAVEHAVLGLHSATLSEDGSMLAIDLVMADRPDAALRLAFPAAMLGTLRAQLEELANMTLDPNSGLREPPAH